MQSVNEAAGRLVERARRGDGPALLECQTYRYFGHHVGDINREYYRPKAEEQEWKTRHDPLIILEEKLLEGKLVEQSTLERIRKEVESEIAVGVEFAKNAPYPDEREVDEDVYA